MLTVTLSVAVAAVAAALIGALWRLVGVVSRTSEPVQPLEDPRVDPRVLKKMSTDIGDIFHRLDNLTLSVSDGIERVHRAESRISKTVTSARRLVRESGLEHAGIEAEAEQLRPDDDEGIEPLLSLPQEVEEARTIRVPGGHLTIGAA